MSIKTVENYREHLKAKLKLKTSAELVRYAVRWEIEVTDEPLEQLIEEAALARREARRQGRRERAESPSPKNSRMGVPPSKNLGMEVPSSNFPSMELPSMDDSRINNKGSEQRTETSSSSSPQPPFTEPGEASTTPTTDDDDSQSPDRDDAVEATTLSALTERMAHHLPDKPAHKRNGYVCTSLEGAGIRPTQPLIDRVVQDAMALAETAASKAEADKPRAVPAEVVEWQSGHRAALQFLANGIEPDMQLELARRLEARIREAGFPEIADRCASSRERAAEAA